MSAKNNLLSREYLLENLGRLPKSDIREVLDFIEFIISWRLRTKKIF
ncbi:MAG: hypothetical protein V1872_12485 [bacterium]